MALAQLNQVRLAQKAGLSLADTKRLKARASESQPRFCAEARTTVASRLALVDAEIVALQAKRGVLETWLAHCEKQQAGDACPLYIEVRALLSAGRAR